MSRRGVQFASEFRALNGTGSRYRIVNALNQPRFPEQSAVGERRRIRNCLNGRHQNFALSDGNQSRVIDSPAFPAFAVGAQTRGFGQSDSGFFSDPGGLQQRSQPFDSDFQPVFDEIIIAGYFDGANHVHGTMSAGPPCPAADSGRIAEPGCSVALDDLIRGNSVFQQGEGDQRFDDRTGHVCSLQSLVDERRAVLIQQFCIPPAGDARNEIIQIEARRGCQRQQRAVFHIHHHNSTDFALQQFFRRGLKPGVQGQNQIFRRFRRLRFSHGFMHKTAVIDDNQFFARTAAQLPVIKFFQSGFSGGVRKIVRVIAEVFRRAEILRSGIAQHSGCQRTVRIPADGSCRQFQTLNLRRHFRQTRQRRHVQIGEHRHGYRRITSQLIFNVARRYSTGFMNGVFCPFHFIENAVDRFPADAGQVHFRQMEQCFKGRAVSRQQFAVGGKDASAQCRNADVAGILPGGLFIKFTSGQHLHFPQPDDDQGQQHHYDECQGQNPVQNLIVAVFIHSIFLFILASV